MHLKAMSHPVDTDKKDCGLGCWVDQDPLLGPVANVLYQLDTSRMREAHEVVFNPLEYGLSMMGIEVRWGVLVRPAGLAALAPWVSAHTHSNQDEAASVATALSHEGVLEIEQYLWLRMPVAKSYLESDEVVSFRVLEGYAESFLSYLRIGISPAEDAPRVVESCAEYVNVVQPGAMGPQIGSHTLYLQKGGALSEAAFIVEALTSVAPRVALSVWLTLSTVKKHKYGKMQLWRDALSAGPDSEVEPIRCRYQVTLHEVTQQTTHEVQALLRGIGLDFRVPVKGILGWGRTPKSFTHPGPGLERAIPAFPLGVARLEKGGVLLQTRFNTPITLNLFDSVSDHNLVVMGQASTGCLEITEACLDAHLGQGHLGWFIGDMRRADGVSRRASHSGATVLRVEQGLNVLARCTTEDDVPLAMEWLCSLIGPEVLTDAARWRLYEAVRCAWQHRVALFSLADVQRELEQVEDRTCEALARTLAMYTGEGPYARFFAGAPLELSTDALLVLDTQEFAGHGESMLSMTLLFMVLLQWEKMGAQEVHEGVSVRRKMVVFDPLRHWATNAVTPGGIEALYRMLRRARKLNGSVLTQFSLCEQNDPELVTVALQHSGCQVLLPAENVRETMSGYFNEHLLTQWAKLRGGACGEFHPMLVYGPRHLDVVRQPSLGQNR